MEILDKAKGLLKQYPNGKAEITFNLYDKENNLLDEGTGFCSKNVYNYLKKRESGHYLTMTCYNNCKQSETLLRRMFKSALPNLNKYWSIKKSNESIITFTFLNMDKLTCEQIYLMLTVFRSVNYTAAAPAIFNLLNREYGSSVKHSLLYYIALAMCRGSWYGFETLFQRGGQKIYNGWNRPPKKEELTSSFAPKLVSKTLNYCYCRADKKFFTWGTNLRFYNMSDAVEKNYKKFKPTYNYEFLNSLETLKVIEEEFLLALDAGVRKIIK